MKKKMKKNEKNEMKKRRCQHIRTTNYLFNFRVQVNNPLGSHTHTWIPPYCCPYLFFCYNPGREPNFHPSGTGPN